MIIAGLIFIAAALLGVWLWKSKLSPAAKDKTAADEVRASGGALYQPPQPAPLDIVGGIQAAFSDPGPERERRASLVAKDVENEIIAEIERGEWSLLDTEYLSNRYRGADIPGKAPPIKLRYLRHRARYRALTPEQQLADRIARASDAHSPGGPGLYFGPADPDRWQNRASIPIDLLQIYDEGDAFSFTNDKHAKVAPAGGTYLPNTRNIIAAYYAKYPNAEGAPARESVPGGAQVTVVYDAAASGPVRISPLDMPPYVGPPTPPEKLLVQAGTVTVRVGASPTPTPPGAYRGTRKTTTTEV